MGVLGRWLQAAGQSSLYIRGLSVVCLHIVFHTIDFSNRVCAPSFKLCSELQIVEMCVALGGPPDAEVVHTTSITVCALRFASHRGLS